MRWILIFAGILSAACAQAATLTFTVTACTQNNLAIDCDAPPNLIPATNALWLIVSLPEAGIRDSAFVSRGYHWPRTYRGLDSTRTYQIVAYHALQVGTKRTYGCPVMATKIPIGATVPTRPAAPTIEP
jgi:hypothetical protein